MHPTLYSMIMNLVAWVIAGFLAWVFSQPVVFLCALLMTNHFVQPQQEEQPEPGDYDGDRSVGFTPK